MGCPHGIWDKKDCTWCNADSTWAQLWKKYGETKPKLRLIQGGLSAKPAVEAKEKTPAPNPTEHIEDAKRYTSYYKGEPPIQTFYTIDGVECSEEEWYAAGAKGWREDASTDGDS